MTIKKLTKNIDSYFNVESVNRAYNGFAQTYDGGRDFFDNSAQLKMLNSIIPKKSKVLDVGCGSGIPIAQYFVNKGHEVTGTDICDNMLELARENVTGAEFIKQDMVTLNFEENTFDLIISFYSIFHTDRQYHGDIFKKFHDTLKPGGFTYFTLDSEKHTGQREFHGAIEFNSTLLPYSHFAHEKYRDLIFDAGFDLKYITCLDIGEKMPWVLAQKPIR